MVAFIFEPEGAGVIAIGHFGKYHNILCLYPQILHKHCFQFLLGITMVPRENKNNVYAKFGGTNKEYYGIFRSGLLHGFFSPFPRLENPSLVSEIGLGFFSPG